MNNAFKHTSRARPTTYKGVDFRSELEAAWACFFDLRDISYDYEPLVDLLAWRPDFQVMLASETIESDPDFVLVEVKPYLSLDQWKDDTKTLKKITDSYVGGFVAVLLGASPMMPCNFTFGLGDLVNPSPNMDILSFGDTSIIKEDWQRAKNTVRWRP